MTRSEETKSYGQILSSTTLVGGSQVISMLMGILRMKFFAVFLGPVGVGLMGMYNSMVQLVTAIAGLGIGSSAVRQVAESSGTGDRTRISRTALAVRRLSVFLGLFGALIMIIVRSPLSRLSFGDPKHGTAVGFLSLAIFFGVLSAGLTALLQGLRRVADIARITIFGSLFGTLLSIPVVYLLRESGIVPVLIIIATTNCGASWWFAHKITFVRSPMAWADLKSEGQGLISLGLAFMASSLMSAGVMYIIRVLLIRDFSLEGVGLYQAAFTLSGMYIGIILNAMGMDYYPRLAAVADDHETCNQMIRQQTEIGLLMATPAIIATLLFAPLVIKLFYSRMFISAYGVLRWQILGVFLRVVSWPVGYIILAKGKALVFFLVEFATNATHLALMMVAIKIFGLEGAGIAFFGLYALYAPVIFFIGRRYTGFSWLPSDIRLFFSLIFCIGVAFALPLLASDAMAMILGTLLTILISGFCLKKIYRLAGHEWFSAIKGKALGQLRFKKRNPRRRS
jgi:enterobacterial common antigen flippase